MLNLPSATLWEATAILQLIQALGTTPNIKITGEGGGLFSLPGVLSEENHQDLELPIDRVYRDIDNSDLPYVELLRQMSGWPIEKEIVPPKLSGEATTGGGIVICPFGPKKELDLTWAAWRSIVRLMRSYRVPIWLLGAQGQWMDQVAFTESEILSEEPIARKIEVVASADVLIGVPCEWMWIAAGFVKSLIVLYPEQVPNKRWFHYSHDKFGRIIFSSHAVDIPRIMAGLAKLVAIVT